MRWTSFGSCGVLPGRGPPQNQEDIAGVLAVKGSFQPIAGKGIFPEKFKTQKEGKKPGGGNHGESEQGKLKFGFFFGGE